MQSNGDSSSSSGEENEWQVLSLQGTKKAAATKPRDDFTWHDGAILDCLQFAIDSHKTGVPAQQEWNTPSTKPPFSPQPIPLPSWAVDPLLTPSKLQEEDEPADETALTATIK